MMRYLEGFLTTAAVLLVTFEADGAPLVAPVVRPQQHVYLIPIDYKPPALNETAIRDLEVQLAQLNYPFYVVVAATAYSTTPVPLADKDKVNALAAAAIDGLINDWSNQAAYDVATSQVFLWLPALKEYRFTGGARWKVELGFFGAATARYSEKFLPSMIGSSKNPHDGILAVARSVDAYLVDQTDPVRIAARAQLAKEQAEAAAREAESKARHSAAAELENQTRRLHTALSERAGYLPPNAAEYRERWERDREALKAQDPAAMRAAAEDAAAGADELTKFVNDRKDEAFWGSMGYLAIVLVASGVGLLIASKFKKHSRRLAALRQEFAESHAEWTTKVDNAVQQYTDFNVDRGTVASFTNAVGETAILYAEVSAAVDGIYYEVAAMQEHLASCKDMASKATFFNIMPLIKASDALTEPFDFDTGRINKSDLFGPATEIVRVDPATFRKGLQKRFADAMAHWTALKAAAQEQLGEAKWAFSPDGYNALARDLTAHGVSLHWIHSHPVVKDPSLYSALDALRERDPVSYTARVAECKSEEAVLRRDVDRLVAAAQLARAQGPVDLPDAEETVVQESDDPAVTLDRARREEAKLAGLLAAGTRVRDVETQAAVVNDLYVKAAQQAATVRHAQGAAATGLAEAEAAWREASEAQARAAARIKAAEQVHASVAAAAAAYEHGLSEAHIGEARVELARGGIKYKRHLEGQQTASSAVIAFRHAVLAFGDACRACVQLDEAKAAFEARLARGPEVHRAAAAVISKLGAKPTFGGYRAVSVPTGRPVDYAELSQRLESEQAAWRAEADRLQRAEDDRLAAIRREEARVETARVAAIRAEEARRQAIIDEESRRQRARRAEADAAEARASAARSAWSSDSSGGTTSSSSTSDSSGGTTDSSSTSDSSGGTYD